MESTVYAMLAGFQNFGQSISVSLGLALSSGLGVEADTETNVCNFEKLPQLVVISHIVLPLCVIPLTFFLIPDLRMTDSIQIEHDEHSGDGELGQEGGSDSSNSSSSAAAAAAKKKTKKKKQQQQKKYGVGGRGRRSGSFSDDSQVGLMDAMSDDENDSDDNNGGDIALGPVA
eukprot:gene25323-34844_t